MNKHEISGRLNDILVNEWGAMITYLIYAAKVNGPHRPQLSQLFLTRVANKQQHARYLAAKVVALGNDLYIETDKNPPVNTNREMLEAALNIERDAVVIYTQSATAVEEYGDDDLITQFEDRIRDASEHVAEMERLLSDESLSNPGNDLSVTSIDAYRWQPIY